MVILQGLPGSGKSTWAKEFIAEFPMGAVVRINNDDLAEGVFGDKWRGLDTKSGRERRARMLAQVRKDMVRSLLSDPEVNILIVDNTNLRPSAIREVAHIAAQMGAIIILKRHFLSIPVEECIRRDAERPRSVGAKVIEDMAKMLPTAKRFQLDDYPDVQPYDNDAHLPHAYIFDIDGTLALMNGRGPYDYSKVHTDLPNVSVRDLLLRTSENFDRPKVIIMSGRDDNCREETMEWLDRVIFFDMPEYELFMRKTGDKRPDWIVKHELFQEHVAGKYFIEGVFDDRDSVVYLWRNQLKLPTFQVADGAF